MSTTLTSHLPPATLPSKEEMILAVTAYSHLFNIRCFEESVDRLLAGDTSVRLVSIEEMQHLFLMQQRGRDNAAIFANIAYTADRTPVSQHHLFWRFYNAGIEVMEANSGVTWRVLMNSQDLVDEVFRRCITPEGLIEDTYFKYRALLRPMAYVIYWSQKTLLQRMAGGLIVHSTRRDGTFGELPPLDVGRPPEEDTLTWDELTTAFSAQQLQDLGSFEDTARTLLSSTASTIRRIWGQDVLAAMAEQLDPEMLVANAKLNPQELADA